jgi:predicted amidohydrolase YtcJ
MKRALSVILFLLLAACGPKTGAPDGAATLFFNGTIYTGAETMPTADAVVVEGDRIAFVGALAEARARAGKDAREIDLKGAFLYPGFTDAHAHLLDIGHREIVLNLEGSASIAEVQERLKAYAATLPPGSYVIGRGWIETHWPEGRPLNRHDLDAVVADRPVFLARADGHAAAVNSVGLQLLSITRDTPVPEGGYILKDEAGDPTGLLVDAALAKPDEIVSAALAERTDEAFALASDFIAAQGWTGIHDMGESWDGTKRMEELSDAGQIKIRVYTAILAYVAGTGQTSYAPALLAAGPRRSANGKIIARTLKLYMDGSLGSRGALLFEPYRDADTSGLLIGDHDVFLDIMKQALRVGIQVDTHAIGDKANRLILDWYAEAFAAVPEAERAVKEPRWRVEHAQHVSRQDWPRFAALAVIPSMQPSHAIGDLYFAPARLGLDRLAEAYPWQPLIDAGAIIPGGSDAPVERGDPRIEFYAAVTRHSLDGFAGEGWHTEYAVSRETALKMFTLWPAFASFEEDELGTIEAGKLADFTVFGADLMTIPAPEILTDPVVLTVVGGEVIYQNPDF